MPDEITITLPRETFQMAREFIKAFGQALDAADQTVKAQEKGMQAEEKISGLMGMGEASPLGGFAQELNSASNRGLGM